MGLAAGYEFCVVGVGHLDGLCLEEAINGADADDEDDDAKAGHGVFHNALAAGGDGEAPRHEEGDEAVCQVEGRAGDADDIPPVGEGVAHFFMEDGIDGVLAFGIDKANADNVIHDEGEDDHGGDALEHVSPVATVGQLGGVGLAAEDDDHAVEHVKEEGRKQEGPLYGEEVGRAAQGNDGFIKGFFSTAAGAVGQEVEDNKEGEGNNAGEGVETAQYEFGVSRCLHTKGT